MSEELFEKRDESVDTLFENGAAADADQVDAVAEPQPTEAPAPQKRGLIITPAIQIDCGEVGTWGFLLSQGCVAPVRQENDGSWMPSQIMPLKLANYLPVFLEHHKVFMAPFGIAAALPESSEQEKPSE